MDTEEALGNARWQRMKIHIWEAGASGWHLHTTDREGIQSRLGPGLEEEAAVD